MQKRGFGAVVLIVAAAVILLLVGLGALYLYRTQSSSSPTPTIYQPPAPSQPPTTQTQPGIQGMSNSSNISDQGINQDAQAIDQQLNSLNSDTSINQSLNDQSVNLNQ